MELQRFLVRSRRFAADDPALQGALAALYETAERPHCMCVAGGVPMYVAKHRLFVVKRMPESGPSHHPECPSFEPGAETSGLGELLGESVIEHAPDSVELWVDFPFSHRPGRATTRGDVPPLAEIHCPRRRMSLLAVMHFLYERAGFNRWYPAMEGLRNQAVLCKYLAEAAREVTVKGECLNDRLYVPEPFNPDARAEIAARRRDKLAFLVAPEDDASFKMALILGEFKAAEASPSGRRIWIRHMPDAPLLIDEKAWRRAMRAYGPLLQARDIDAERKPRVLVAALVFAKRELTYQIDTLSMMLTTDRWIPIDGVHELPLVERLCDERRSFLKPLRYDARNAAAFPNVLLLDAIDERGRPVPLHVLSAFAGSNERAAKLGAIRALGDSAWMWHTERDIPALPVPVRYRKRVPDSGLQQTAAAS